MRDKKGFTLVELLAVIVVLALIMIIAIPSILSAINAARKESFFIYAQSLQSKAVAQYTQDLEHKKENTNCAIYDIEKDLGISDTGKYEGWVKVSRKASSSGKRVVYVELNSTTPLQYVKYCTAKANTCTPDTSYFVEEDKKSVVISQAVDEGYVLCANYQYANNGKLASASKKCMTYSEGEASKDSYKYEVAMTIKDSSYAVENTIFSEDMSMEAFYKEIDRFEEEHKDLKQNKLAISAPTCSEDDETIDVGNKGTTTTKVTTYTTTTTTRGKTDVITTTTSGRSTQTMTTTTTTRGQVGVSTTTTSRSTQTITNTTTTERSTETAPTTTIDIKDETLLLRSLVVSGYDILFNRFTFNYELVVPNNVTSLNITATPMSDITSVNITGNTNLGEGLNPVVVALYNTETGKRSYYRILVKRLNSAGEIISTTNRTQDPNYRPEEGLPDPTLEESNALLSSLSISGYAINFSPEVYDYKLETNGESELFVSYRTQSDGAHASVYGAKDAKDGGQVVITVESDNGYYVKTYTIDIVHKKEDSVGTSVLKVTAAGLGVVLAAALTAIAITRKKKNKIKDDKEDKKENNNNETNQGNVN